MECATKVDESMLSYFFVHFAYSLGGLLLGCSQLEGGECGLDQKVWI